MIIRVIMMMMMIIMMMIISMIIMNTSENLKTAEDFKFTVYGTPYRGMT